MRFNSAPMPQAQKVEKERGLEQNLWTEREELMRKLRELPGNPQSLYLQLSENAEKIRQAQDSKKEVK